MGSMNRLLNSWGYEFYLKQKTIESCRRKPSFSFQIYFGIFFLDPRPTQISFEWFLQSQIIQTNEILFRTTGNVETLEISTALQEFISVEPGTTTSSNVELGEEIDDNYTFVQLNSQKNCDQYEVKKEKLFDAVYGLVQMYCQAFRVNFTILSAEEAMQAVKLSSDVLDEVLLHISCLHRLDAGWTHDEYLIAAQVSV